MKRDFDVLIVGGGMAGAAAAALLARHPRTATLRVAVLEPNPATPPTAHEALDLRVSAMSRASQNLLELTGAWPAVAARGAAAYQRMVVWDERATPDGPGALDFQAAEIGEPDLGHIVENRAVQTALLEQAVAAGVVLLRSGIASLSVRDTSARVGTADGREFAAALVIGADGSGSALRSLAGIAARGWDYEQRAVIAHLRCEHPHRNTAWQRFLDTGPLALLPLADGRVSLVWSTSPELAGELVDCAADEFAGRVTTAVAGVLGRLEADTTRVAFPLRLLHARQYAAARIALIGDAAHTVHPLAGQGINLAFLDVAALVDVVGDALAAGDDPGEVRALRRYERWRKAEVLPAIAFLDGIQRLFRGGEALKTWLRRDGLDLVGAAAPLKRALMRRALGVAGEVPDSIRRPPA